MLKYLLIVLSFGLFVPNVLRTSAVDTPVYDQKEQFDPRLSYINTINKLEAHVDSVAVITGAAPLSLDYVQTLAKILRRRFYHGFSRFTYSENWMAAITGKLVNYDHACKVFPEQIIQYNYAACSQQAVVMMAILRNKKITYRSVLFPHHYAVEVLLHNRWYYFDTNMEPAISDEDRMEDKWHNSADSLKRYYDTTRFNNLDYIFGVNEKLRYGQLNEVPAPNARLFHTATGILSRIFWLFPVILIFYRPAFVRKRIMRNANI